ncbi:hypothetical protein DL96DRAFT_1711948 [Flagelloscypha sp. PMI_526]|nr:hypothetical protein DL96DRAFT_1711948 [Flagelloscypha sp. PMI_526]
MWTLLATPLKATWDVLSWASGYDDIYEKTLHGGPDRSHSGTTMTTPSMTRRQLRSPSRRLQLDRDYCIRRPHVDGTDPVGQPIRAARHRQAYNLYFAQPVSRRHHHRDRDPPPPYQANALIEKDISQGIEIVNQTVSAPPILVQAPKTRPTKKPKGKRNPARRGSGGSSRRLRATSAPPSFTNSSFDMDMDDVADDIPDSVHNTCPEEADIDVIDGNHSIVVTDCDCGTSSFDRIRTSSGSESDTLTLTIRVPYPTSKAEKSVVHGLRHIGHAMFDHRQVKLTVSNTSDNSPSKNWDWQTLVPPDVLFRIRNAGSLDDLTFDGPFLLFHQVFLEKNGFLPALQKTLTSLSLSSNELSTEDALLLLQALPLLKEADVGILTIESPIFSSSGLPAHTLRKLRLRTRVSIWPLLSHLQLSEDVNLTLDFTTVDIRKPKSCARLIRGMRKFAGRLSSFSLVCHSEFVDELGELILEADAGWHSDDLGLNVRDEVDVEEGDRYGEEKRTIEFRRDT